MVRNFNKQAKPFEQGSYAMTPAEIVGDVINMNLGQNFVIKKLNKSPLRFSNIRNGQTGNIMIKRAKNITGFSRNVTYSEDLLDDLENETVLGYTVLDNRIFLVKVA